MNIQPVTSSNPTVFAQWKDQLSKTNWKVHSLVVLGYLLVGIGIALACASPFIALVIHPMIGASSPVLFLGTGALALETSKQKSPSTIESQPSISPPRGLKNDACNCWVNAAAQLLLHVPAYRKTIESLIASNGWKDIVYQTVNPKAWLYPLLNFYTKYHNGESVNSQELRVWLSQYISTHEQDDPNEFLNHFLSRAHTPLPMITEQIIHKEKQKPRNTTSFSNSNGNFCIHFSKEKPRLPEVFKDLFHSVEAGDNQQTEIIQFLEAPPQDFSVSILLADKTGKKVHKLQDAMVFSLHASQVGEQTNYRCDGFLRHIGTTTASGHWIAYFYENGHWWEANDDTVKWISSEKAKQYLSTASFIHYAKVY